MKRADRRAGQLRQFDSAGLELIPRPARTVSRKHRVAAALLLTGKLAQSADAAARTRPSRSQKAESMNRSRNQFAIKALADEDACAVLVFEAAGRGQQALVPEAPHADRPGHSGCCARFADVFVTKRRGQCANKQRDDGWHDHQQDAAANGVSARLVGTGRRGHCSIESSRPTFVRRSFVSTRMIDPRVGSKLRGAQLYRIHRSISGRLGRLPYIRMPMR